MRLHSVALIMLIAVCGTARADEFKARITRVIDGDSIRFEHKVSGSRVEDECRLLHYNAPEMTGPERPEGKKAHKKLNSMIAKHNVIVWGMDRDRYGRLLCEVRLPDGRYINEEMSEFLKDFPRRDIYRNKERTQHKREDDPDRMR